MKKKNLAVICGGQSTEHEVSLVSGANIISLVAKDEWELYIVCITKDGRWLLADSEESLRDGSWERSSVAASISPDAVARALVLEHPDGSLEKLRLDAVFPVLHGKNGEDGTIQGLLSMSGIPYVGCGVLASAQSMDKFYTKIVADSIGVKQAAYVEIGSGKLHEKESLKACIERIENELCYPVFVKPSRAGSSVGVSKAHDRKELERSLFEASKVDSKILAEEFVAGREIECAVLKESDDSPTLVSGVGEILAAGEFYDYEAKYHNAESRTVLDPELPPGVVEEIRKSAVRIFDALCGFGLSRVDFFVKSDGTVIFNEINTLPGFTPISMYPMLWERAGIKKEELIARLLESAFHRGGLV